jgi:hypothetical protein
MVGEKANKEKGKEGRGQSQEIGEKRVGCHERRTSD